MFLAGAVFKPSSLVKRRWSSSTKLTETATPETSETSEPCELRSVQRESSGSLSDLNLQEWQSLKSLMTGSPFSEAISDRVTTNSNEKKRRTLWFPLETFRRSLRS